jgi:hypothetical protein
VRLQRFDQLGDRALLDEADLGVARDVVAEREQLLVHQLLRARRHLVARGVRGCELRDEPWDVERLLQRGHLLDDIARGLALGGRFLGGYGRGHCDDSRQAEHSLEHVSSVKRRDPTRG